MLTAPQPKKAEFLAAIPRLRAFAISLTGSIDRADDLVQETLLKAWSNLASFQAGTNMNAWLFTILRNAFYSDFRKRRREVQDTEGQMAANMISPPAQESCVELNELQEALNLLPETQREALVLIGASGMSYEEAAEICGCAIGTIKSRVNRARSHLAELMHLDDDHAVEKDMAWQSTMAYSAFVHSVAHRH